MRLKYYLRGAGIGIIFATLVMTVSALVHKYNITDEYIIREARKLGMVMKDELKDEDNFWDNDDIVEGTETEEDSETTEDTQVAGSETKPSESESESQTPSESEKPADPEPPKESESEEEVQYVTIVIARGDYARQVAEKVRDAGLVKDAEDFRKYIGQRGYGQSMFPGSYQVPVGSTYEEICLILIKRPGT